MKLLATLIIACLNFINFTSGRSLSKLVTTSFMGCHNDAPCLNSQTLTLFNAKRKSTLRTGSHAMLHLAFSHSRNMAKLRHISHMPVYSMNSKGTLPCGTFLTGDLVANAPLPRQGTPFDASLACQRLLEPRLQRKRKLPHLQSVIGVYVDDRSVVWCTMLFGKRTTFTGQGECARAEWVPKTPSPSPDPALQRLTGKFQASTVTASATTDFPMKLRAASSSPKLHKFKLRSVRASFKGDHVHQLVLLCRRTGCIYCMKDNVHRCYSRKASIHIDKYMSSHKK